MKNQQKMKMCRGPDGNEALRKGRGDKWTNGCKDGRTDRQMY